MEVEANHAMNYVVTAHKPTGVIKSVVGCFTGGTDLNLIVAKANRLEVHVSSAQGLELLLDVPIYGRISSIELFRPTGLNQALLFVLLEKYNFCVLAYNRTTKEIDTCAQGDVRDTVGRPVDNGQIAVIDPDYRAIGLQLYDGMFKVLPIDNKGAMSEAFNTRLDELQVHDITMLAGCQRPTIAVLYQDAKHARHLKAYEVSLKEKDLVEVNGSFTYRDLEPGASLLVPIPAPLGGVLVLGEESIVYVGPRGTQPITVSIKPCVLKAWGRIDADGSRLLMSDNLGLLYVLVLSHQDGKVTNIKIEILGRTSSASSISYLDDGLVFVGSRQGDSQLIKLYATPPDPSAPKSYIQVMETWRHLGPITDFSVMDLDRQGQGQLVCCSGTMSDGSLRVVRNGVGINEQASIELTGIRGLWSLRSSWQSNHHKYLVLTFVGETRMLAMNQDEELDEAELSGFDANSLTLWCGNSASDHIVQVTPSGVRAIAADSGMLESEWRAQDGQLSVAAGNGAQVAVASGGGTLRLLEVNQQGITEQAFISVNGEIACVDVTPIGDDPLRCHYVAVGTWNMSVLLYAVRGDAASGGIHLELMTIQQLEGQVIPRSVMMWCFEDAYYLLVGLGDGQLHYWKMHETSGALHDRKRLILGSKPVMLRPFKGLSPEKHGHTGTVEGGPSSGRGGVFAASDRPAVLYSSHKKILFANLNENEVTYMAPFNSVSFPDSLAIAKENSLIIGTVDQIQKLHIHTVPLHEQPRRIHFQEETHTLGVITISHMGMEDEANYVRVFDAGGAMEQRASFKLNDNELGCSIVSCKLGDNTDPTPYFVVGTAIAQPDEPEPTKGRLLVLQFAQGKLTLVSECAIKGAAYEVLPFQGGKLLSSCNNKVAVHRWIQNADGSKELQQECSASAHIIALYLAARGDHVIVGDLMRSVSLFLYKEGSLDLRAQDYASNWCTAVAMLDDDTYLAAENSHNLVVVKKNTDATADEDRGRLEVVGEFHTGEFINRVRPGSLVLKLPDSELAQVPTWLFGSIDGTVGVIASLPPPLFDFLSRLQDAMRKVVKGVGGLSHADWRAFENERKTAESKGFVDGDLVELFLDLKHEDAWKVVSLMGGDATLEEVTQKVEELARLH